ncbi:UNVERIFIED_ORG: hypothetical protein DFS12_10754 [Chitinophaga ginsengisegetis]|nr:hypothetical protein [Chitinophaga ginsengisegetis]MDR6649627.1 hypothetical protein [Chitinophaga ginsengisegetis]MDR6656170.1 hypothetical protein [Chitinophaga ginsengisegetis]
MLLICCSVRKRKWVFDGAKISGFCLIQDYADDTDYPIFYFSEDEYITFDFNLMPGPENIITIRVIGG